MTHAKIFHLGNIKNQRASTKIRFEANLSLMIIAYVTGKYTHVADVEVSDHGETCPVKKVTRMLEDAFDLTNHEAVDDCNHPWQMGDKVLNVFQDHPRSTMVGDIVEMDGNLWAVKDMGFSMIPKAEIDELRELIS